MYCIWWRCWWSCWRGFGQRPGTSSLRNLGIRRLNSKMSEPLDSPDLIFFNYLLNRKWRMSMVHTYCNPPGRDTFYILHPTSVGEVEWWPGVPPMRNFHGNRCPATRLIIPLTNLLPTSRYIQSWVRGPSIEFQDVGTTRLPILYFPITWIVSQN